MSKTRSVIGLLHALLLLAGAAGYAYLNFPQLLQQQLARQLPESGLQGLQYQHPQLSLRFWFRFQLGQQFCHC